MIIYTVVIGYNDPVKFSNEVNSLLGIGWKLQGGVAIDGSFYAQAMTKEENKPELINE